MFVHFQLGKNPFGLVKIVAVQLKEVPRRNFVSQAGIKVLEYQYNADFAILESIQKSW
jgi:hypothetical protein